VRRGALCGLLTACLGLATVTVAAGQATDAGESPAPEVAIGQVRQTWNRVEVDYGLVDGDSATLLVEAIDGDAEIVDKDTSVSGTLTWDRLMAGTYAPLGSYRLTVVGRGPGGQGSASKSIGLRLLYVRPARVTRTGVAVPYYLAEAANVVMQLRLKNGRFAPVERRSGVRGPNRVTWDFHLHGKRVPAGQYSLRLVATTGSGAVGRAAIRGERR
jgi:hypothetical protein